MNQLLRLFFSLRLDIFFVYLFILVGIVIALDVDLTVIIFIKMSALVLLFFCGYLTNRLFDFTEDQYEQKEEALHMSPFFLSLISLLVFTPLPILFYLRTFTLTEALLYLVGIVAAAVYSIPLGPRKWRIKRVLFLKNIWAAGLWFISLTLFVTMVGAIPFKVWVGQYLYLFFLFLGYELLFDVKDRYGDQATHIKTVPLIIGVAGTRLLIISCSVFALFLIGFRVDQVSFWSALYLLFISFLVKDQTPLMVYHLFLIGQGTLLLFWITVIFFLP